MRRFQERDLRVKIPHSKLPTAETPPEIPVLKGHNGIVWRVVALPESKLVATACCDTDDGAPSALRIFSVEGDGEPLHTIDFEFEDFPCGLAVVGDDTLACGGVDGKIMTCRASRGERLDSTQIETRDDVTAMAVVGDGVLAVGCDDGTLFSLTHSDGRNLRVVTKYKSEHSDCITDIAVRGNVVVTASVDKKAAVWSAETHERLAVLRGHRGWVRSAAIGERFIATGSRDKSIRLYENKGSYSLVRVLEGLHTGWVQQVQFVGKDMLMSASWDKNLVFTSLSTAKPIAREKVGFKILSVAILSDGRLVSVGWNSEAVILSPPPLVTGEVKKHAATLFPSPPIPES